MTLTHIHILLQLLPPFKLHPILLLKHFKMALILQRIDIHLLRYLINLPLQTNTHSTSHPPIQPLRNLIGPQTLPHPHNLHGLFIQRVLFLLRPPYKIQIPHLLILSPQSILHLVLEIKLPLFLLFTLFLLLGDPLY